MKRTKSGYKFAFQGLVGAFSHEAAILFAERNCNYAGETNYVPFETFADVFSAVERDDCDFGIIPLENSSIGSIVANFDLLWNRQGMLVGEIVMPVHHNLMVVKGTSIDAVRQVFSHPAALEQCRQFFQDTPHLKPVAFFDTSGAAKYVSEKNDCTIAAIASELAAKEYGLSILCQNIEDYSNNCTRFGVITPPTHKMATNCPEPPYKISCAFELLHQPGALAEILIAVAKLNINLTKIESRPIPEAPWHYSFFLDMEINTPEDDEKVLAVLANKAKILKLIGRYKATSSFQP